MLKIASSLAFLALTAISLSACEAKPRVDDGDTHVAESICSAIKSPTISIGVKVTLEAEFISDRQERSLLQDDDCPKVIVSPYDGIDIVKDEGYQAFARILDANPLQVGLVRARVKVYGTLRMEAPNRYRLDVIRYIESSERKER
jgi:hypothetical protein